MHRLSRLPLLFVVSAALGSVCRAQFSAGAAWPAYGGDGRHTGMSALAGVPGSILQGPTLQAPYGGHHSQPAIDANHNVYCHVTNATSVPPLRGLTSFSLLPDGQIAVNWTSGIPADGTPAIGADGTLYAGSGASVVAVRNDGTLLWQQPLASGMMESVALGPDGVVYAAEDNGDAASSVRGFAPDGTPRWSYQVPSGIQSTPAINPQNTRLYFGCTDNNLYALDISAGLPRLAWKKKLGGHVDSSPALDSTGNVYVVSANRTAWKLSPAGATLWTYSLARGSATSPWCSPALDEARGTVYSGGPNAFFALNMATGALRWSVPLPDIPYGHPAIDSRDGVVYLGGRDAVGFRAITPAGQTLCQFANPTTTGPQSDFYQGAPAVDSDGTVWIAGVENTGICSFRRPSLP